MSEDAVTALAILWTLCAVTFVFVLLRLYTRIKIVQVYGIDDHFFNAAFIVFLIYNILITRSALYGFGKNVAEIPTVADEVEARLLADSGQSVLVIGMVVAKTSMALFLMRIVVARRHKAALLTPVVVLGAVSVAVVLVLWFSCTPTAFAWDPSIDGECNLILQGSLAVGASAWSVLVDLWYAAFPWYLLWGLQMPRREKLLIGCSMSFGVLAAASGIMRSIELVKLANSENYLKQIVPLIIWHGAEISVTMICIGVAVCRPIYKNWVDKITSSKGNSRGQAQRDVEAGQFPAIAVHTIGGTAMQGPDITKQHVPGSGQSVKQVPSLDLRLPSPHFSLSDDGSEEVLLQVRSQSSSGM
ncbi:hypothetical protein F5Y15DRAFT_418376 [Xylariaceae sp. FL0016]|nr:hypothetical protein F5Y15DRAFT_418376 [Xylariaceae sp. FL0016]